MFAMTVMLELAPDVEQIVKARAIARGISLEDYLPSLIAQAAQEEEWQEENMAHLTMLGAMPVLSRIWNTPEEDEAWKDL